MAQRVVLHIGTMKSGTSYLQNMLFAQRRELAEAGVLVPGRTRSHQIDALLQGRGASGPRDLWQQVLAELRDHPGDAVLSSELLGANVPRLVRNLLPDLADTTVELVLTIRDLNRSLVSMWQETVQNGRTWTWEDYYASVRDTAPYRRVGGVDRHSAGGRFWKQQDVAHMVAQVLPTVGAERLTLVTVPPRGADRTVLPARFAEATGIPLDAAQPSSHTNESLGLASVLVIRELNEALENDGHPWPDGILVRKRLLAKRVLPARADEEPRLGLDPPEWVREQTAATVDALKTSGVRIVGDWTDLDPIPVPGVRPADVDSALVSRAAIAGLAALIAHQIDTAGPDC